MNIIPTNQRGMNTSFTSYADREIQGLVRQKMQIQEQIKKVSEGKMDAKTKQEKIKELSERITDIESQIRQRQTEKMMKEAEKAQSKSLNEDKNNDTQKEDSEGYSTISQGVISAGVGYTELKTMSSVRTKLKGELRMATQSGDSPEAGQGIQSKIEKLEKDMGKKINKIDSDLRKAAKEVKNKPKPEEEDKGESKVSEGTLESSAEVYTTEGATSTNELKVADNFNNKNENKAHNPRKTIDIRI